MDGPEHADIWEWAWRLQLGLGIVRAEPWCPLPNISRNSDLKHGHFEAARKRDETRELRNFI